MAPTGNQQPSLRPHQPSIQSFYAKEVGDVADPGKCPEAASGEGFTEDELADALDPLTRKWNPEKDYEELPIAELIPGPRAVNFAGRIVYLNRTQGQSQTHPKASGWHNLIVKDDSAAIAVKLYFAKKHYPLKLGQLIEIWTSFVSDASKAGITVITDINLYTNLFPGRVTSDHLLVHTTNSVNGICQTPLSYREGSSLQGLITLESYMRSGGNDGLADIKLLVCVKSIGPRKRIVKKTGGESDLADIMLFDHSGEVKITVWNDIIASAKDWQVGRTILLITNPGWVANPHKGPGKIGIVKSTMIDVDPDFREATWLRRYVADIYKREASCVEFPDRIWDIEASKKGVIRALFTFQQIDQWARSDPQSNFSGFVNVVIMEFSLVTLHRRNMLMCGSCCGATVYANASSTTCENCSRNYKLIPNPAIIGKLVDETGCISGSKLIWHDNAWSDIFGRTLEDIVAMTADDIRLFEQRAIFMRMHLWFGWASSVGRLCIMAMMA